MTAFIFSPNIEKFTIELQRFRWNAWLAKISSSF